MRAYIRALFGLNRDIRLYLLAFAFGTFAVFGVQGVLLNLYWLRLGYDTTFIGLLIGAGQLSWGLAALPAAAAGRLLGLRTMMVAGSLLMALSMSLLLVVERLPPAWWSGWLFAWWLLFWIGAALFVVNSTPYLMNIAGVEERGFAFSASMAVLSLAAFAGSLISGWLVSFLAGWLGVGPDDPAPYRYALWLAPIGFLMEGLIITQARPASLEEGGMHDPEAPMPLAFFAFLGVVFVLTASGEGAVRSFYNIYLNTELGVPASQIGLIMGMAQLVPVAAALAVPVMLARWGTGFTFSRMTLLGAACMVPIAAIPQLLSAAVGYIGVMAATAAGGAARGLFSQEEVVPRWRGVSSALNIIGLALGWGLTAALGGYLITMAGFRTLFYICAVLMAVAGVLLWAYSRRRTLVVEPAVSLTVEVHTPVESEA